MPKLIKDKVNMVMKDIMKKSRISSLWKGGAGAAFKDEEFYFD